MDFKHLTPELIGQLSLTVASKTSKESNIEELCIQVFDSYAEALDTYKKLKGSDPSVYEKRGIITG